jgi:hypothetical protein
MPPPCLVCAAPSVTDDELCAACAVEGARWCGTPLGYCGVELGGRVVNTRERAQEVLRRLGWSLYAEAIDPGTGTWLLELPAAVDRVLRSDGPIEITDGDATVTVELP